MMAARKKKPEDKNTDTLGSTRSMRADAEEKIARSKKSSSDLKGQTPEKLIHELQVHRIELETQAEELRTAHLALEESRDKYLDLYDFAPVGYLTLTDKELITEVNLTGATLLGVERSKLVKARFQKFVTPQDHFGWNRYFASVLKNEKKLDTTLVLIKGDGSTFTARLESIRLIGNSESPTTVRVAISDITDIWQLETLRESEERFRTILHGMQFGIVIIDAQTHTILDANHQALEIIGGSNDDVIGKLCHHFICPAEYGGCPVTDLGQICDSCESFLFNLRGKKRFILKSVIKTSLGGKDVLIESFVDITERKQMGEALHESEKNYHSIFANAVMGIYQVSKEGQFLSANNHAARILGYESAEELIQSITDIDTQIYRDPETRKEAKRILRETGVLENFEVPCRHKDGHTVWVSFNARLVRDAEGNVLYHEGTSQDITERKVAELELVFAQDSLKEAHHLAHIGTWDWVMETDTVTWSDELYNIAGMDPSQPAPTYAEHPHVYTPASWDLLRFAVTRALTAGEPYNLELELVRPDGSLRWVNAFGGVKRDGEGKVIGLHGTVQDITERKRAEEALQLNNFAIVSSINAIAIADLSGNLTYINPAFLSIWGYEDRKEVLGRPVLSFWGVPDEAQQVVDAIQVKGVWSGEMTGQRKDGTPIPVQLSANLIRDASGTPVAMMGSFIDITKRKLAEEALRETNAYLNNLFDYANAPIIVWDPKYVITRFNHAFEDLTLISAQEIIGQRLDILFPKESRDTSLLQINKTLEGEWWETVEIPILVKDGSVRTVLWNSANILDTHGRIISTIAHGVDITEREMMESEIRSLNRDLEQRIIERTSQLNASLEDKEVLLREVHHRVRNNFQIIISLLFLQSKYIEDKKTQQVFKESQNRIHAMALVHDKLYQSTDMAKIDLDNYFQSLGNRLLQFYRVKGRDVILNTSIQDIHVDINTAIPIGLIFNELVSNSLKHAFPDGRRGKISIAMQRENTTLTILFKDNGVGIHEDFDWRNAESLGLRLVISLVGQLDGNIELDRCAGTAYTIRFPAPAVKEGNTDEKI